MATDTGLFLLSTVCVPQLLLTCSPPLTAASRLPTAYKRALQELHSKLQSIRAELIHRDHPDSTLSFARGTTPYAATPSQKALIARCLHTRLEFTTPFSFEDVPHATDAEYVMTLYLRPPPQKLLVIVHTGSDLVWVNCQPCTSPHQCYNQTENPFFDPYASNSYSAVPCTDDWTCNPLLFSYVTYINKC